MKPVALKVARIGNSRGVRLPAATLARYRIGEELIMEERSEGILLRPPGRSVPKLSWAEPASALAAESEDWTDWQAAETDGLQDVPWEPAPVRRIAEPAVPEYSSRRRKPRS